MARNIKNIVLKSSTDGGTTWKTHSVMGTPHLPPEQVDEENSTAFGDEYRQRLPTLKDRDLMEIKVRDDGDSDAAALAIGCQLKWRLAVTFSDRSCAAESTVTKENDFMAYIQRRTADTVEVEGKRVAVINLTLRPTSAMTPVTP